MNGISKKRKREISKNNIFKFLSQKIVNEKNDQKVLLKDKSTIFTFTL